MNLTFLSRRRRRHPIICFILLLLISPVWMHGTCVRMTMTTNNRASSSPRVAIIGAGAAGLASAKAFESYDCVVIEKDDVIGGVWRHVPNSSNRPMYSGLRTNLPKEIMSFREFPWKNVKASFVTHKDVLEYLHAYADEFALHKKITFETSVRQLTVLDSPSKFSSSWKQIRLDYNDGETSLPNVFDAVCICNGHYSLPVIPNVPGLDKFSGRVLHSIAYDKPEEFKGRNVLCVGGRASGSDLAREIAKHAAHVYLSDTVFEGSDPIEKYNVTWLPATVEVLEDRVKFKDCNFTPKVDVIIFCTGYDYHFPFINEKSNLELDVGGRRVAPLYEQLWHAQHPNLAFLGLPHSILPFPFFELQAAASERQWRLQGTDFPPDMLEQARRFAESGGEGKEHGRVPEDTHYLGSAQWDYCRRMAKFAGLYNDDMEDYLMTNKAIWDHSGMERKGAFPGAPDDYRETVYERDFEDQSYKVVHSLVDSQGAFARAQ